MAYPPGYWAELVRSSSRTALVEDAAGTNIWLRTSDGEPLEQQRFSSGSWVDISSDTTEPDLVFTSVTAILLWRAQKTGEDWIPSDDGLQTNTIPWNGAATYRFFSVPPEVAPSFDDPTGDPIMGTVGTPVAAVTVPEANGFPAPTYAAVGALPAGVTFDPATRQLSFDEDAIRAGSGTITIRAKNSVGTMGYPENYWAEFVRSRSSTSLVEDVTGVRIWLRTSDGEPLEQEGTVISDGSSGWFALNPDSDAPDYIQLTSTSNTRFRARKTDKEWLPSNTGIRASAIPWNGSSTYRFFTATPSTADWTVDYAFRRPAQAQTIAAHDALSRPNLIAPPPVLNAQFTRAQDSLSRPGLAVQARARALAASDAVRRSAVITQARQLVLPIGAPDRVFDRAILWNLPTNTVLIDRSLVERDERIALDHFSLGFFLVEQLSVALNTLPLAGRTNREDLDRRDLIRDWEQSPIAVELVAGGRRWLMSGPDTAAATMRDDIEPYSWFLPWASPTQLRDEYLALTAEERNNTVLVLTAPAPFRASSQLLQAQDGVGPARLMTAPPVELDAKALDASDTLAPPVLPAYLLGFATAAQDRLEQPLFAQANGILTADRLGAPALAVQFRAGRLDAADAVAVPTLMAPEPARLRGQALAAADALQRQRMRITEPRQDFPIGAPTSESDVSVTWDLPAGLLEIDPLLTQFGGLLILRHFGVTHETVIQTQTTRQNTYLGLRTDGPDGQSHDLTEQFETSPTAVSVRVEGRTWVLPGPNSPPVGARGVSQEPYAWRLSDFDFGATFIVQYQQLSAAEKQNTILTLSAISPLVSDILEIGAGDIVSPGGVPLFIRWAPPADRRISGAFFDDGHPGYLRELVLTMERNGEVRMQVEGADTDAGLRSDLVDLWEFAPEALRITAGGREWVFHGPDNPLNAVRDSSEPYAWQPGGDAVSDFVRDYSALSDEARANTLLRLSYATAIQAQAREVQAADAVAAPRFAGNLVARVTIAADTLQQPTLMAPTPQLLAAQRAAAADRLQQPTLKAPAPQLLNAQATVAGDALAVPQLTTQAGLLADDGAAAPRLRRTVYGAEQSADDALARPTLIAPAPHVLEAEPTTAADALGSPTIIAPAPHVLDAQVTAAADTLGASTLIAPRPVRFVVGRLVDTAALAAARFRGTEIVIPTAPGTFTDLGLSVLADLRVFSERVEFGSDGRNLRHFGSRRKKGQRWRIEYSVEPTVPAFGDGRGAAAAAHAASYRSGRPFDITMPQLVASPPGTPRATGLEGEEAVQFDRVLPVGLFVSFAGDPKVYQVTGPNAVTPPLAQDLNDAEVNLRPTVRVKYDRGAGRAEAATRRGVLTARRTLVEVV